MMGVLAVAGLVSGNGQAQTLGIYPGAAASADADRLSDVEELTLGTDPNLTDTDGDFISDSDELLITGTDPLVVDSDLDGLTDYEEWMALVPKLWDVDGNGLLDIDPLGVHPPGTQDDYSPYADVWWTNGHLTDYDGEGISDREEITFGNFGRFYYMRAYVDWPNGEGETYDNEAWDGPGLWDPTDYDRDGLNAAEEAILQTDPYDPDTDGDGLQDGLDANFANALLVDTDSNGISDHDELMYYAYAGPHFGSEENLAGAMQTALGTSALGYTLDWDGDGMSNVWEIAHGLNPVDTLDAYDDPDGDFLLNFEEYDARTDPQAALSTVSQSVMIQEVDPLTQLPQTRAAVNDYEAVTGLPLPAGLVRDNGQLSIHQYEDDWDGDGTKNRDEILGTPVRNPRYNDVLDSDGDGLFDTWEVRMGLDKTSADEDADSVPDGSDDFDGDGLTNQAEQTANTNPLLADTDGDGLPDAWEVAKYLDPVRADQDGDSIGDAADNFDTDSLTNEEELAAGTNPLSADTDGDGLRDDWELAYQLNPLSSAGIHGGAGDADGDGFSNAAEFNAGSSPQSNESTPPATFTFRTWAANGESYNDNPEKYETWVFSPSMSNQEKEYTIDPEDESEPYNTANEAAEWMETTMAGRDYAGASVSPTTFYNPDVVPAPEARWVGLTPYPVSAQADFRWLGHEFYANYRRVRLEVTQPVAVAESRSYVVLAETEVPNSLQAVGSVTFTLAAGQTKANVTLSPLLGVYGVSVASDGKTLVMEPGAPTLTSTSGYMKRAVYLVAFGVQSASIRKGLFTFVVPDLNNGATGTLELYFRKKGSSSEDVLVRTLSNVSPGQTSMVLDHFMNQDPSPLDGHNAKQYDRVKARWISGSFNQTSGDHPLDVHAVEVLARRRLSNYFSPSWLGTWGGNTLQKGVYAANQFPSGLRHVSLKTQFLNSIDPMNEGLGMDGGSVLRLHVRAAQTGYNRVSYLNGSDHGYIEKPDRDQDNASSPSVRLLRATSVAVRTNADRLVYDDELYIPEFSIRSVDDSGGLNNNTDQIDIWRGQGDQALLSVVNNFGDSRRRTCLKIIRPTP